MEDGSDSECSRRPNGKAEVISIITMKIVGRAFYQSGQESASYPKARVWEVVGADLLNQRALLRNVEPFGGTSTFISSALNPGAEAVLEKEKRQNSPDQSCAVRRLCIWPTVPG